MSDPNQVALTDLLLMRFLVDICNFNSPFASSIRENSNKNRFGKIVWINTWFINEIELKANKHEMCDVIEKCFRYVGIVI